MYLLCVFEASNKIVVIDTALEFHSLRICSNVFLSLYVFMYFFLFLCYRFSTERAGKKNLKIGQHLATIWTKVCGLLFGGHPVHMIVKRVKHYVKNLRCLSRSLNQFTLTSSCMGLCESPVLDCHV